MRLRKQSGRLRCFSRKAPFAECERLVDPDTIRSTRSSAVEPRAVIPADLPRGRPRIPDTQSWTPNSPDQIQHVSDTAVMVAACRALETARADGLVRGPFAE